MNHFFSLLLVEGREILVADLSAGGLSFPNVGLEAGHAYGVSITLPFQESTLSSVVEVIRVDREGVCRCRFRELAIESAEAIQGYIVQKLKEEENRGSG